ncbi:hypothetical protein [Paenibacillus sp. OSY-SE]|uniref:hypothetical protein n=1 Tax=Paenibacillus sp. OSY-SE TaxID=1196323 RepID=UPI0002E93549|nr:hypothetical protein [Paenibacillus sp. OSY-SE]
MLGKEYQGHAAYNHRCRLRSLSVAVPHLLTDACQLIRITDEIEPLRNSLSGMKEDDCVNHSAVANDETNLTIE